MAGDALEPALTALPDPLLVVILGPTASGKTALSLVLAERFQGEIINCDSVAMYREFDIGAAKPSAEERSRLPQHLFDIVEPAAYMTAGEYGRQARQVLDEVKARGHLPVVVGGAGLYLRALLEGLFRGPQRSEQLRERLRERVAKQGSAYLHRILRRLDPAAADKLHANDAPKLIRAIEICLASRAQMTEMWKQGRDPLQGFRILRLGLKPQRDALYARINERARRMFDEGLIEETKQLLELHGDSARPLASLGYRQAVQLLRGEVTLDSAVAAAQQAHRNYAKRQMTWFRREPEVVWLSGFGDEAGMQRAAMERVSEVLGRRC
ncbi:MAG TPA: tRNA (adenosine(37)-N6)-dimethylallyltransferase MiaA [Terriglobales bacterium]|nr:tRNA (adenosine(37)-N6)-dimethylallyltransferase MiaA [Terriglobales bacterium]